MSTDDRKMKDALCQWVVPYLVAKGFKGKFPHYRRCKENRIDLITFQFSICIKAFSVNIANCPVEGIKFKTGEIVGPNSVNALHCLKKLKLGEVEPGSDHWFCYDSNPLYMGNAKTFLHMTSYKDSLLKFKNIADDIIALIKSQAEPWWSKSEAWWEDSLPSYNKLFFYIQNIVNKC